jgi:hypothetical protein
MLKILFSIVLLFCVGCSGCVETRGYLKCRECGAAYKSMGGILPPTDGMKCCGCGGQLFWTTKELSGWDEERYQKNGDEIK